jgi:hypothetical protein
MFQMSLVSSDTVSVHDAGYAMFTGRDRKIKRLSLKRVRLCRLSDELHVRRVRCHRGMSRPQVAD